MQKMNLLMFNKCCFCVPLRYGLIFCGSVKLILLNLLALLQILIIGYTVSVQLFHPTENYSIQQFLLSEFILLISLIQIVVNIVFVIGVKRKNVKLLRIYFLNSVLVCVTITIIFVISLSITLQWYLRMLGISYILLEVYLLLLLRSEINYRLKFPTLPDDSVLYLQISTYELLNSDESETSSGFKEKQNGTEINNSVIVV